MYVLTAIVSAVVVGLQWGLIARARWALTLRSQSFNRDRVMAIFAMIHLWGFLAGPESSPWLTHFVGLQWLVLVAGDFHVGVVIVSNLTMGAFLAFAPVVARVWGLGIWCAVMLLPLNFWAEPGAPLLVFVGLVGVVPFFVPDNLADFSAVGLFFVFARASLPLFTGKGPEPYVYTDTRDLPPEEYDEFLQYVNGTSPEATSLVLLHEKLMRWTRGAADEADIQQAVINEHVREGCPYPVPLGTFCVSREFALRETQYQLQLGWGKSFFDKKELPRLVVESDGISLEEYY